MKSTLIGLKDLLLLQNIMAMNFTLFKMIWILTQAISFYLNLTDNLLKSRNQHSKKLSSIFLITLSPTLFVKECSVFWLNSTLIMTIYLTKLRFKVL